MNKHFLLAGGFLLGLTGAASAALDVTAVNADWTVNTVIPAGNPVGITAYQSFQGLPSGPIVDVSVDLDITGGYNGALVGYLTLQDANGNVATEFLLNQVGTSPSNPFGSAGAGFNITLSDAGTVNGSIHGATGVPTGTWLPDSANTLDGTFGGLTANGTWTLFLADVDAGTASPTLLSWGLNVVAVPEPRWGVTAAVGLLGLVGISLVNARRAGRRPVVRAVR